MRRQTVAGALLTMLAAVLLVPVAAPAHMNDEQSPYRVHITTGPLAAGSEIPIDVSVVRRDETPATGLRLRMELYRGFSQTLIALRETAAGTYAARVSFEPGRYLGIVRVEGGEVTIFGDLSLRIVDPGAVAVQRLVAAKLDVREGGFIVAPPWVDQVTWIGLVGLLVLWALYLAWRSPRPDQPREPLLLPSWVLGLAITGAAAAPLGAYWDIAWHVDRGRETFWSPPHFLIYGSVASVLVTVLIGVWTLPRGSRWPAFRQHRGLKFAAAATILELASAPFDEFWHLTFGLDTSVWSPPHLVLLFGGAFSLVGLALLAAERVAGRAGWLPRLPVLFVSAAALTVMLIFVNEFEWPVLEDWSVLLARPVGLYPFWYSVLSCLVLAAGARASEKPGSATAVAVIGWGLRVLVSVAWLPTLGTPIPLLPPFLVVAGVVIDLVTTGLKGRMGAGLAYALGGVLATGLLFALHIPTTFLMPIRQLPGMDLVAWLPLALVAALAAGYVGFRLGALITPVAR